MALIVAFVVALVVTPVAARVATRYGVVAEPGPLRVHTRAIPYLGGLAVLAGLLFPVGRDRPSYLVPIALAAALGLADDVAELSPVGRLLAQVGIAIAAAWVAGPHDPGWVVLGAVVALVLVNAVNFLDGLDGLATAVTLMGAVGFYVVLSGASATLGIALVGALAGFLVWNAPPARVFLGDSGSYLIGTVLAMLFIGAAQRDAAVVSGAFLFVAVPVADMVVAIVRRLRAHRPLLRGDRGHVYDQLVDRGWPAPSAVLACVAAQTVLTAAGIAIASLPGAVAVTLTVATVAVIGAAAIWAFTSPRAWTPD